MKWLPLLRTCIATAFAQQPPHSAQSLPAFKVWPLFTLTVPGLPRSSDNVFSFQTIDNVSPERWRGFIKFRSTSLQTGDEVVSIEGKHLTEMQPNEGRRLLSFVEPGKKISIEVKQPRSKIIRKATIVRIDSSEEIVR